MKKLIPILLIFILFAISVSASPKALPACCPSTFNDGAAYASYLNYMNEQYPGYSNEIKEERAQDAAEHFSNVAKGYIEGCQIFAADAQRQYESGINFCNEYKPRLSYSIGLSYYDCSTKSIKLDKLNEKVAELKERTKTGSSYGILGTVDQIEIWENKGTKVPNALKGLRDGSLSSDYFSEPDVLAQAFENCIGSINAAERCAKSGDRELFDDFNICMKAEMRENCYLRYYVNTRNYLLDGCETPYSWAWDEEWWSGVTGKTLDEPTGDHDYKVDFNIQGKVLNLNGEESLPLTIKVTKKDENGKTVPASNEFVPTVFIEAENNALIGEIVGGLSFDLAGGSKQKTDSNGILKTKIIPTNTKLGEKSDKIQEVPIYVYASTTPDEKRKQSSFRLKTPPVKIKRVYKPNKEAATAGNYNRLVIEVDDPSNLKKTYYVTAGAGDFMYDGKFTKANKLKFKTTENTINLGWAPPDLTRKVRVNQLKTLKKHLIDLRKKAVEHYKSKAQDSVTERFIEELPESVQQVLSIVENANDKLSKKDDLVKYLDGSINTLNEMEGQYFKMFEHDATNPGEFIARGALMTIGSKEVVDGAVGVVIGEDDEIQDIAKSKGIDALKDYLANELEIIDSAKGREWMKSYTLRVTVTAGGAKDTVNFMIPAKGLEAKYSGK